LLRFLKRNMADLNLIFCWKQFAFQLKWKIKIIMINMTENKNKILITVILCRDRKAIWLNLTLCSATRLLGGMRWKKLYVYVVNCFLKLCKANNVFRVSVVYIYKLSPFYILEDKLCTPGSSTVYNVDVD
jgi:hypothetical protein